MSALALPRLLPRTLLVALGSALAGGLVVLAVIGAVRLFDSGDSAASTHVFHGAGFSIGVPAGWTAARPDGGDVMLRRADGHGVVIVRRTGPIQGDLRVVARDLTTELRRQIPGFHLVSARVGRVRAGGAFVYTFVRGTSGAAQSLALTRVDGVTYRLDTIVPGAAPDAARQAGAIVASFGP